MHNRKKEFAQEYWQQGKVLITKNTSIMSDDTIERMRYDEACCAFVRFNLYDEGRSRELVCRYKSPKRCIKEIKKHNDKLRKKEEKKC